MYVLPVKHLRRCFGYTFDVKMATEDEKTSWPREDETKVYLQNHRILELFNNLTAQLTFNRPGKKVNVV